MNLNSRHIIIASSAALAVCWLVFTTSDSRTPQHVSIDQIIQHKHIINAYTNAGAFFELDEVRLRGWSLLVVDGLDFTKEYVLQRWNGNTWDEVKRFEKSSVIMWNCPVEYDSAQDIYRVVRI